MNSDRAIQFAQDGAISEKELRQYGATSGELFVVWTGKPAIAQNPVTMRLLIAKYDFWPTSNFIALSDEGRVVLDRLGYFQDDTEE
jgi:hypothetical protein